MSIQVGKTSKARRMTIKRVYMLLAGASLFAVGGCVTAEALADVSAVVDVVNLILGGLTALI